MCACFGATTMSGWGKQNLSLNQHSISKNARNVANAATKKRMQFIPFHPMASSNRYKSKSRIIATTTATKETPSQLPTYSAATPSLNAFGAGNMSGNNTINLHCQSSSSSLNQGLPKTQALPPQQRLTLSGAAATVAASSISLEQLLHRFSLGLNLPNNVFTQTILGAFPFLTNYVSNTANSVSGGGITNFASNYAPGSSNSVNPTLALFHLLQLQAAYNALLAQAQAQAQQQQHQQQQQQLKQQEKQAKLLQQQQLQNFLEIEASQLQQAALNQHENAIATTAVAPTTCLADFLSHYHGKSDGVPTSCSVANNFTVSPVSYICANCGSGYDAKTAVNVALAANCSGATPICFDLLRNAAAANSSCYCSAAASFNNASRAAHQYEHVAAAAAAFSSSTIASLPPASATAATSTIHAGNIARGGHCASAVSKFQFLPCSLPLPSQQAMKNPTKPTKAANAHGLAASASATVAATPSSESVASNEFTLPYPIEYRGTVYYSLQPPVPSMTPSSTSVAADKVARTDNADDIAVHVTGLTRRVFFNGKEYVFDGAKDPPPGEKHMYLMISDDAYNNLPAKSRESCAVAVSEPFSDEADDHDADRRFLTRSNYPTSPPPRPPALYGFRAHMLAAQKQESERQSKNGQEHEKRQPSSESRYLENLSQSNTLVSQNTQPNVDAAASAQISADDKLKQQRSYSLNSLKSLRKGGGHGDSVNVTSFVGSVVPKQILKSTKSQALKVSQAGKLHVSQSAPFGANSTLRSSQKVAKIVISQPSLPKGVKTKSEVRTLKFFNATVGTERVKKLVDHSSKVSFYKEYSYGKLPKYGFKMEATQHNTLASSRTFNSIMRRHENAANAPATVHENSYGKLPKYSFKAKTTSTAGVLRTQLTLQTTGAAPMQAKPTASRSEVLPPQLAGCNSNEAQVQRTTESLGSHSCDKSSAYAAETQTDKDIATSFSACLFINEFANVPKTSAKAEPTLTAMPLSTVPLTLPPPAPTDESDNKCKELSTVEELPNSADECVGENKTKDIATSATIENNANLSSNNKKATNVSFCGAAGDAADINSFLHAKAEAAIVAVAISAPTDNEACDFNVHYNANNANSNSNHANCQYQRTSTDDGVEDTTATKMSAEERARRSVIDAPSEEWPPLPKPRANNSTTTISNKCNKFSKEAKSTTAIFTARQQQNNSSGTQDSTARQVSAQYEQKMTKKQLPHQKLTEHAAKQSVPTSKSSTTSTKLSKNSCLKQNGACLHATQPGSGRSHKSQNLKNSKPKKLF